MNNYWRNSSGNFPRSPSEGARSEDNLSGWAREGSHVRDNLSFEQPYLYLIYPCRLIFICHLVCHSYFPLNGKYLGFSLAFDICRFSATVGAIPPNKTEVNKHLFWEHVERQLVECSGCSAKLLPTC